MRVYRWRAHGGSGDDLHLKYRDEDEGKSWHVLCPLLKLEKTLRAEGVLNDAAVAKMEKEFAAEIESAFDFAANSPIPEEKDLYTHVYSD